MDKRKVMAKKAKKNVKHHYVIFLLICLIAAFIGSESSNSISTVTEEFSTTINSTVNKVKTENIEQIKIDEKQKKAEIEKESKYNSILGRTRGVFSLVVNSFDTGSIYISLISAFESIVKSKNIALVLFILLATSLVFLVWFLFVDTFKVISRRMFLEGRVYSKVTIHKMLFLIRIKKLLQSAKTMFLVALYETLWSITIIGGIIKRYSYYLVPYIVAENPSISSKDAIKLSRDMMDGHKFECFKMELSFIGWDILGLITFGLANIFYINMYKVAFFCEYYENLRRIAKEEKINNAKLLNDKYLYEKADKEELTNEYKDVIKELKDVDKFKKEKGFTSILTSIIGVKLFKPTYVDKYDENEANKIKLKGLKEESKGESYPKRLFIIKEKNKAKRIETLNYVRHYSVVSLILLFFAFSFVGWAWEVTLHLISDGVFVNRGTMFGPWLPIYGGGAMLILILLYHFRKNPMKEFVATVIVCGITEYFTSWQLEMTHGMKWWDYSGYFLNLNGRICAEGLLVFGLGGLAIVYFAAPAIDNYIKKINLKVSIPIVTILLSLFMVDKVYSSKHPNMGKGITDYDAYLYVEKYDYTI